MRNFNVVYIFSNLHFWLVAAGCVAALLTGCTDEAENTPPTSSNVTVTGVAKVGQELSGTYEYSDVENDLEGQTKMQWYVATSDRGDGEIPIAGATMAKFIVSENEQDKFIRFGVTPIAITGTLAGKQVKSAFTSAVQEETEVTFTYNNQLVTYGIIKSSTGRKWLDRNLGAASPATSASDWTNAGDLFQWGRQADGHQVIVRTGPDLVNVTVTATTSTLSTTDVPTHALFISTGGSPNDWRSPQNNNLWQGVNGINNPCPAGWRLPTEQEWIGEGLTSLQDGYEKLNLTLTGYRFSDGQFLSPDVARYWTSTVSGSNSKRFVSNGGAFSSADAVRVNAYACRCIKN
jgi:hypothetical protein